MVKILLVEDNELLRTAFARGLGHMGFDVSTANDGADGYEKAVALKKELGIIISDVAMPVVGGFELLRQIRADSDLHSIPFIFLSANADLDFIEKARSSGMTDYLIKDTMTLDRIAEIIKKYS